MFESAAGESAVGETIVRPRAPAAPQPLPAPVVEAPPVAPASKRGLVIGIVSAVAVLLIAVVVVASILLGGVKTESPDADEDDTPGGGSAIVEQGVPDPQEGTATPSADGTSVVFAWSNPDEQEGDSYRYALSANPGAAMPLDEPTVTIDGVVPGAITCIDVYIKRSGQISANPLNICYPEQEG